MKKAFKLVCITLVLILVFALSISLVACNKNGVEDVEYFANDMYFEFGNDTTVVGIPFSLVSNVFDADESYFTFTSNGKVHGQLKTKTGLIEMLEGIFKVFDVDMSEMASGLSDIDLDEMIVKPYVVDMFPGFTLDHIEESFNLMKNSLGLSIVGIDYEHEIIKEIESTHRIPSDILDRIPEDFSFGIAFDQTYYIKTVVDADGNEQKAVYIGGDVAHNDNTQPFVIFTMTQENGVKVLKLNVEFILVNLVLKEKN